MIQYTRNMLRKFLGMSPMPSMDKLARAIEGSGDLSDSIMEQTNIRVSVAPATNGKVLIVSIFKRNPNGPDWTHTLTLVPTGENIAELIAARLVAHAITT